MVTDHKRLTTIFGSKKGIPTVTAARLQMGNTTHGISIPNRVSIHEPTQQCRWIIKITLEESHTDENSSAQTSKVNLMQLDSIPIINADLIHYCPKCIDTLYMDGQQKLTKNYDHISQGDWRSPWKMSAFYGKFE